MRSSKRFACRTIRAFLATLLLAGSAAFAGVTVTQNLGAGATSWPGAPILKTVDNPGSELVVGEGFGGGATSYAQTFTLPAASNYTLESIQLYAGGGNGTSASATIRVNLYDLGGQLAPDPSSYAPKANLLGDGDGLLLSYATQPNGLLKLDFDGEDQIQLVAGRMYALELEGVAGAAPMNWIRGVADTYPGGAAYRDSAWINSMNERDFGLAVYGSVNTDPVPPAQATVDATITHQTIDGFGAGAAYLYDGQNPMPQNQMDVLYGVDPGEIGLTIIRVRILQGGGSDWDWAVQNGQKAHQLGAKVLATPWTPPPSFKSNNNIIGGKLLPEHYGAYVEWLNLFLSTMEANGAPVSVISLQNEPDFIPDGYEGCEWTAEDFHTFCRDFAGDIDAPVMMPESFSFDPEVSDVTLNDPIAAANVDYIGGHLYGATIRDYPLAHQLGKHTWMTEYLVNDQTIQTAIATGQQINDCLTIGNMNAYIWWKLIGDANGLLNNAGAPQKRAYVMAQFSRFVRPGYRRIGSSTTGPLSLSAFTDPESGKFVIIVANATSVPVTQQISLAGINAASVTPWITSASHSLAELAPIDIEGQSFSFELPAYSIVTFAGRDGLDFDQYLASLGLSSTDHAFALDFDGDSMATGYEYLIGSNPEAEDYQGIDWKRNADSDTITIPVSSKVHQGLLEIQTSNDLKKWTTKASYDWTTNTATGLDYVVVNGTRSIQFTNATPANAVFYRIRFSIPN